MEHNETINYKIRLILFLIITLGLLGGEFSYGILNNSKDLMIDAAHILNELAPLVIAIAALMMSTKTSKRNTYGWARAEILAAITNAIFLVSNSFVILVDSVKGFTGPIVYDDPMNIFRANGIGLFLNCIGLLMFNNYGQSRNSHKDARPKDVTHKRNLRNRGHANPGPAQTSNFSETHPSPNHFVPSSASQMNIRGVFLHVLTDTLRSVKMIIVLTLTFVIGVDKKIGQYLDPALNLLTAVFIISMTWPLFHESSMILLQAIPSHMELKDMEDRLIRATESQGELHVDDLQIWQLTGHRLVASAHIRSDSPSNYIRIAERVKEFFHNEGIHSTTVQPEFSHDTSAEKDTNTNCISNCDMRSG